MTSVLYRAKRKDNFEWVEGYYAKVKDYLTHEDIHVIFPVDCERYPHGEFDEHFEIIPETLCRLLDYACYDACQECGRIFQNDVLAVWGSREDINHTEPKSIVLAVNETTVTAGGLGRWFPQDTIRVRVIGNAYDNPELIEGHDMNHFINSLKDCPYNFDEYIDVHRYLTDKYSIHGAQACCYMCNFENDYICHQYNGGCSRIDICRNIRESESKRKEK